jgi:hypothetical protein
MLRDLVSKKNNKYEFGCFFKKTLCLAKIAITFTYEVGLKSFLYEKYLHEKLHPNSTTYGRFVNF